jgi:F-type H+-transporting ATPase subunit alpha
MDKFEEYLDRTNEIGTIDQIYQSIVYVEGIPRAKPKEMVMFESGELGEVLSLTEKYAEILLFSKGSLRIGTRVVRTNEQLMVPIGEDFLGSVIDPKGSLYFGKFEVVEKDSERRPIDISPLAMVYRRNVREPLETGVSLVDTVIPLGKGQRELVIGDRKTAKTQFVMQVVLSLASQGFICVYGAIAKRHTDILALSDYFKKNGIANQVIVVATAAADPSGLIFLTPYTAMTVAEYFRDKGKDVVVVLDDLTIHAKAYREISLLAKRFPGRSSYPGDVFFIHSRLMERAGNFEKGSITCLPIAETVFGDISGYIQTNLMAMTDGHIFFDRDLANLGRRPPINPFLSVTRVGHQTQSALMRDLSRELSIFLVHHDRMRQFLHFGGEVSEMVKQTIELGERVLLFFDQSSDQVHPLNVDAVLIACLWAGIWVETDKQLMKRIMQEIGVQYKQDEGYKKVIDEIISQSDRFSDLVEQIKHKKNLVVTDRIMGETQKEKSYVK